MRILPVSDLHFEFHPDRGRAFVEGLPKDADVLVVAGDLSTKRLLMSALRMLCSSFEHVVFVCGNHEFYGSNRRDVMTEIARASATLPNLHHLDCDVVEIDGVRFAGTPLWFRPGAEQYTHLINDFKAIRGYRTWVYEEAARARRFIADQVRPGDVVVTHHLPSHKSVATRYQHSPLNAFFVHDVEEMFEVVRPGLWLHGHTHDSFDYRIRATRVVCNPLGYATHPNRNFDDTRLICGRCHGDVEQVFASSDACRC
jgi:Icc-related predicted phosphoesterase